MIPIIPFCAAVKAVFKLSIDAFKNEDITAVNSCFIEDTALRACLLTAKTDSIIAILLALTASSVLFTAASISNPLANFAPLLNPKNEKKEYHVTAICILRQL